MLKKQALLITGCGGMLGEAVYHRFRNRFKVYATDIDLNEPWLKYLDVSDIKAVFDYGQKIKPDFIIHLAALTDMEYCEMHPEETHRTNAIGTENMVSLAKKLNVPLVYISTAGIFRGDKDEYDENDQPEPLSVYGKSKYQGELAAGSWNKSIIIRAGWMIGGGPKKDKKFVNKIIKQLKGGAVQLAVVDDKLGTPTYTYDLAKVIEHLLEHRHYGLYHGVCDGGGGSRHDVAVSILENLGFTDRIKIQVVSSDYFRETYFAPRPTSERLSNQKLKVVNSNLIRNWRECLKEYLEKFDWMTGNES